MRRKHFPAKQGQGKKEHSRWGEIAYTIMTVFARITAQRSVCKLFVCVCVCVYCCLEGIVEQVCGDQSRKDLVFHAKCVPGPHDHPMGDADPRKTSSEKQGDWICPLCKSADLHPALVFCLFVCLLHAILIA